MRAEGEGGKGEGEGGKGRVAVLRLLPLLQDRQGDCEGEGGAGRSSENHSVDSNPPGTLPPRQKFANVSLAGADQLFQPPPPVVQYGLHQ